MCKHTSALLWGPARLLLNPPAWAGSLTGLAVSDVIAFVCVCGSHVGPPILREDRLSQAAKKQAVNENKCDGGASNSRRACSDYRPGPGKMTSKVHADVTPGPGHLDLMTEPDNEHVRVPYVTHKYSTRAPQSAVRAWRVERCPHARGAHRSH